jgi:tRNA splicing endonuclease
MEMMEEVRMAGSARRTVVMCGITKERVKLSKER